MGIDRKTRPKFVTIIFPDKEDYIETLRKTAEKEDLAMNDGKPALAATESMGEVITEEIYYDDDELHITFSLGVSLGEKTFISLTLPLSHTVKSDILKQEIKKYNKIRAVLDAAK